MRFDTARPVLVVHLGELAHYAPPSPTTSPNSWCVVETATATARSGRTSRRPGAQASLPGLLANMTADSLEASSLGPETPLLVRGAALAASDAPTVSYVLNRGAASKVGSDADQVCGVLVAIGTDRRHGAKSPRRPTGSSKHSRSPARPTRVDRVSGEMSRVTGQTPDWRLNDD